MKNGRQNRCRKGNNEAWDDPAKWRIKRKFPNLISVKILTSVGQKWVRNSNRWM